MEPDKIQITPKLLYDRLNERLRNKPDLTAAIGAHIRAKTGHNALKSFYDNGADTRTKIAVLAECLSAVSNAEKGVTGALDGLMKPPPTRDTLAGEQAETPPHEIPTKSTPEIVGIPAPPLAPVGLGEQLAALVSPFIKAGTVDEDAVRHVARQESISAAMEMARDMRASITATLSNVSQQVADKVDAHLAKIPPRDVVEIKRDGQTFEVKGRQHKQFKDCLLAVTARRFHDGYPQPLYAYGAPGAGKTRMWSGIAEAMGLSDRFYSYSCAETDTGSRMIGFLNVASGKFDEQAAVLYRPYKFGGLAVISEVDLPSGGVMAGINNLIENGCFTFPNGEKVERHKDFHVVCDANTIGKGQTAGFVRNKLDAATRTRFAFMRIVYDVDLERALAPKEYGKWVDYVLKVRAYVETNCKETIYITPRASYGGAAWLASGLSAETTCDAFLFTDMSEATKETVISNVGRFE